MIPFSGILLLLCWERNLKFQFVLIADLPESDPKERQALALLALLLVRVHKVPLLGSQGSTKPRRQHLLTLSLQIWHRWILIYTLVSLGAPQHAPPRLVRATAFRTYRRSSLPPACSQKTRWQSQSLRFLHAGFPRRTAAPPCWPRRCRHPLRCRCRWCCRCRSSRCLRSFGFPAGYVFPLSGKQAGCCCDARRLEKGLRSLPLELQEKSTILTASAARPWCF